MFSYENVIYEQLCLLRDTYNLQGIKAEFEAEGSSFRDLVRLRRLTDRAGIRLYLKIGGVEAVRDIKDSLEISVDGLIAPMCESRFGVRKFIDSYKKIYRKQKIHLSINVETQHAIDGITEIVQEAEGFIDNITIGRSDLSGSYFDLEVRPDSDFVFQQIQKVIDVLESSSMTLTVGGSFSKKSVDAFQKKPSMISKIKKIETRKVILNTSTMLEEVSAINECLKFEELYILSKKEFSDLFIESEVNRLTELKRRF